MANCRGIELCAAGLVFDIRDLLQRQFDRLSEIEQEMIVWLAITGTELTA